MPKTTSQRVSEAKPAKGAMPRVTQHEVVSEDRTIPVWVSYPPGYAPGGAQASSELLPWLVYLHAGGFVQGDSEAACELASDLSDSIPAVVVTPGYSLAPDHPFPAAPEDAVNTVAWVLKHARRLKVDKLRFAVVGEEAGATSRSRSARCCATAACRSRPVNG